jgi:hypothetical protein
MASAALTRFALGSSLEVQHVRAIQEGDVGGDTRVRLIRPDDRSEGQMTPGMRREQAVSTDRSWGGYVSDYRGRDGVRLAPPRGL